jgi:cytochrome c peroxidase
VRVLAALSAALFGAGCSGTDGPGSSSPPDAPPDPLVVGSAPAGFPPGPLAETGPPDNILTEERAVLGRRLFFERRLSRTGEIACASCHDQAHGFSDPRTVSLGVDGRSGMRNAPALSNLAWGESFFWDGRAESLEAQAGMPIQDMLEMDLALDEAVQRVAADADYVEEFRNAYDAEPTEETLRKALASFVRTLVSGASAYDRHLSGDSSALEPAALRGEALFSGKAGCFHCHPPGALTNEGFFNNGIFIEGGDVGRQRLTGRARATSENSRYLACATSPRAPPTCTISVACPVHVELAYPSRTPPPFHAASRGGVTSTRTASHVPNAVRTRLVSDEAG